MSLEVCSCDGNLANLGQPGCLKGLAPIDYPIFLNRIGSDGTRNCIPSGSTINAALITAALCNENPLDRWYPQKDDDSVQNVLQEQGDANTEEFPSGKIVKLADGITAVSYQYVVADPYKAKAKLEQNFSCNKTDVMFVDRNGSIVGECIDGNFYGRRMQKNSLVVKVVPATDDSAPKIEITFNLERASNDILVDYILGTSIPDYNMVEDVVSLIDVNIEIVALTVNDIEFKLTTDWGDKVNRIVASGLDATTLDIYNITDAAVIALLGGIVEDPSGTYKATFAVAQTVTDLVKVRGILDVSVQKPYDLKRLASVSQAI